MGGSIFLGGRWSRGGEGGVPGADSWPEALLPNAMQYSAGATPAILQPHATCTLGGVSARSWASFGRRGRYMTCHHAADLQH